MNEPVTQVEQDVSEERSSAGISESELSRMLGEVFGKDVRLLERGRQPYRSSHGSEILRVSLDARPAVLFVKYSTGLDDDHYDHGSRFGVAYEAEVYRRVLGGLACSTAPFLGATASRNEDRALLVLEYLDKAPRLSKTASPSGMSDAASWLGDFHSKAERMARIPEAAFLKRHDEAYYAGWAQRTAEYSEPLHASLPWLKKVFDSFDVVTGLLLKGSQTVMHGEYCPKNILYRRGKVYPLDWESCGVGAGEIDLAGLVDFWPESTRVECTERYRDSRWPQGAPAAHDEVVAAADLFWQMRWLGSSRDLTLSPEEAPRFKALRVAAERLGIL